MEHAPDALARRLASLHLSPPPTLVPRVLAAGLQPVPARAPRARRILLAVALLAAVPGGNVGASYISPRYAQALASAPGVGTITGPLLQQAGLANANPQALDVESTASGYTVRVFGGYADAVRTTLFVEILGPDGEDAPDGTVPAGSTTLTDQFGHTYQLSHAFGMPVLNFEPLVWPASGAGARLTLSINQLDTPSPESGGSSVVTGPWTASFNLTDAGGHDLPLPAPVQVGDTTYTFTHLILTSTVLEVRWTITGGAIQRQQELHNSPSATTSPADLQNFRELSTPKLLDAGGNEIQPVYGFGQGVRQGSKDVAMEMDSWYPVTAHSTYVFRVSDFAGSGDEREIAVP